MNSYNCRPHACPVPYTKETLRQIWEKARPPPSNWDKAEWRMDAFHALMKWSKYGKRAEYGWEVDRIVPLYKGGGNDMANLRPMHWMNSGARQDW